MGFRLPSFPVEEVPPFDEDRIIDRPSNVVGLLRKPEHLEQRSWQMIFYRIKMLQIASVRTRLDIGAVGSKLQKFHD
jgi:hypothetical protein